MTSPSDSHPGGAAAAWAAAHQALVSGYRADNPNLSAGALSAARHLLKWAAIRRIAIRDIDAATIDRFARHRCRCGRYSAAQLQDPGYITDARRFLRHLEGAGHVAIPDAVARLGPHLAGFSANLATQGYSRVTYSSRISQARHFAEWALQMRVPREGIDGDLIEQFAQHDCQCGIKTKRGKRVAGTGTKDRRRGARTFVAFLSMEGLIPTAVTTKVPADPRVADFATWLRRERGATSETIRRYQQELGRWLTKLGSEPQEFTATALRSIILDQGEDRSRSSVRMTITVLRTFLRFMIGKGHCAPSLLLAVPSGVRRRLSNVPKTIPASTIEEIVASCAAGTAVEVRDRAIILLLARMALRAGDIWQLRLTDIDWRASRLRLHGKSRRGVFLPLPQDVGDALLAYIEDARPVVASDRVFLRAQAPFTPFRSSAEIAGIVSRVLSRARFVGLPTGAHVFRHSLASTWLRSGAELDQIGAALRHASRDTTAIYAKVDIDMLGAVAQPWPGCAA
ncbi:tyrosine-type recombinase/integrase [Tabrizicola sp.]|uniref:tyrosine-type recombinase/integrase n=1 Tax=Tabrizicola sp. TaxID=2005166 RepID=UPI0025E9D800|nr:tyrosine-type recombinase/integrase [Tabrizicola sp.]MBY0351717.1 tyrosine-type recombinase/integrase [Tabrizicola sp.]